MDSESVPGKMEQLLTIVNVFYREVTTCITLISHRCTSVFFKFTLQVPGVLNVLFILT